MSSLLPFIVAGLTTGSVYGLAGAGLVLTYKTSRIFNFAHGALATVSAYLFYTLNVQYGMAWQLAAIISLVVAGPLLGLVFELIARGLATASLSLRVASTVGVLLIVQAAVTLIFGTTETRTVPVFLGDRVFRIGDTAITQDKLFIWAIGLLSTLGLYVFFRTARMGVAMRAVVDDPALVDLTGTSPNRVRRWAWSIGVTFAAASGLLLAPLVDLTGTTLTLLVVQAFGAAAIGGFTSIPMTYVGGLFIGVTASVWTSYFTSGDLLSRLPPALPFIILFVVLLVAPKARLAERAQIVPRSVSQWTTPARVQVVGGVALVGFLCFVPSFAGIHLNDWTVFLADIIIFLSLGLLVRTSGQVSLCHVSFTAIGATAFSHLAVGQGVPWLVALLLCGLIAVPIGALLAIPAIRLSGLYLALATFGFGLFLSFMFYSEPYMFGRLGLGLVVPRPEPSWIDLSSDSGYYYLVLLMAVVTSLGVLVLVHSRLGRLLRALSDSPHGLATGGTSVNVTRVTVFCISSFLAAIGGALAGGAVTVVTADNYQPFMSLTYFALIIVVFGGAPWYAVMAAIGLALVPSYITSPETGVWMTLVFGIAAVLLASLPDRMRVVPAPVTTGLDRLRGRPRPHRERSAPSPVGAVADTTLEVTDLKVAFGGLVAVDGVSLVARTGRITGVIGPNGAGKTTTFNACSGLQSASSGSIRLDRVEVARVGVATRARRGLGRTFQQMELFDSMTVRENVELGVEASAAGLNVLAHLVSTPSQRRSAAQRATESMERCGLSDLADRPVSSLSTGQRRLVELARCLAGPARLLLLDEPSSGLDHVETEAFGRILREAVRDHNVGILLVEHDMELVTGICDYIYVLDFGRLIFEGPPDDVMAAPVVQAAYLGTGSIEPAPGANGVPLAGPVAEVTQ